MVKSQILVGNFSEEDLKNGKDKKKVEEMKKKTGLNYTNTKIITKNGKKYLSIWLCNVEDFEL